MKKILLEKVASPARNQTNLVGEILHSILLLRHCWISYNLKIDYVIYSGRKRSLLFFSASQSVQHDGTYTIWWYLYNFSTLNSRLTLSLLSQSFEVHSIKFTSKNFESCGISPVYLETEFPCRWLKKGTLWSFIRARTDKGYSEN